MPVLMHQMRISTNLSLFSGTQAEKVGNPRKKLWKLYKSRKKKPNTVPYDIFSCKRGIIIFSFMKIKMRGCVSTLTNGSPYIEGILIHVGTVLLGITLARSPVIVMD
jgi:hypothetical protein